MNANKHLLTVLLIASSILLLVALQVFWIRASYLGEVGDLRRETSSVLRATVLQLRDSILFSDLKPAVDSLVNGRSEGTIMMRSGKITDTVVVGQRSSSIQVFLSDFPQKDSLTKAIRPLAQKLKRMQAEDGANFTIRIISDSIPLDTLQYYYDSNLREAKLGITAKVEEFRFSPWRGRDWPRKMPLSFPPPEAIGEMQIPPINTNVFSDTLYTDPARLNPSHIYGARLTGVRQEVLGRITPQILFSLFLTTVTILAFVVVYRTLRQQQRLVELKDDFIRNMTHELKTPVATVSVALESLKNFNALNDPQRTQEYIAIAQGELTRLNLLTDKILKTTAMGESGHSMPLEDVDLNPIVHETIQSLRLVAEKNKIEIRQEQSGTRWTVRGAADHLATVIYNLLDNAIKYSPNGGKLTVSLAEKGEEIELAVTDQGIGIAPEFQDKIFDQFFRVPTGDVHTIKGYGLGLHYVKKVVEQHGGSIRVASAPGRGSTFTLHLPAIHA